MSRMLRQVTGAPVSRSQQIADALDSATATALDAIEGQFLDEDSEVMAFAYAAVIEEAAVRMSRMEGYERLRVLLLRRIATS